MDSSQTLTNDTDALDHHRVLSGAETEGISNRTSAQSHVRENQSHAAHERGTIAAKTGVVANQPAEEVGNSAGEGENDLGSPQVLLSSTLLTKMYGPILGHLSAVEECLNREMQSPHEDVSGLLQHGIQLGGKRLRPAIHLLMAESLGQVTESNVVIGAVLEMVHTATLIHDDVLDEAQTRRHVPTINANWNEHTSILLGDYLFAQSFRLAASLGSTRTCSWVGEAARLVCEGELRQVLTRNHLELDELTYYEMIQGKTAELCRVATSLAAAEAGACDGGR